MNFNQNQLKAFSRFYNSILDSNIQLNPEYSNDRIPLNKKGNKIHIKEKNKGKFTESAKRAGMGVQEFASHVLYNKDRYSTTLVKRANFARNAKSFNHSKK